MSPLLARLLSLASAVLLLFSGSEVAVREGDRVVGSMLLTAGMIVLGVWVALEVRHDHDDDRDDPGRR